MSNIITCGRREEGKTTLSMYLARRDHPGVVVFDPRGQIAGIVVYNCDDLEAAIEEGAWKDGPIVYRDDSGEPEASFNELSSVLFPPQFPLGGFSLVVDESGFLQNAHYINRNFARAIKEHPTDATGPREESVTIIQNNHRLAEFNNTCKALMNELYIFQTTHPGDLKVLGEHTDGSTEIARIVKNLDHHHCLRYYYGRRSDNLQYEVWDDPAVWYSDFKRGVTFETAPQISKTKENDWYV